jgi:hypothetical protein
MMLRFEKDFSVNGFWISTQQKNPRQAVVKPWGTFTKDTIIRIHPENLLWRSRPLLAAEPDLSKKVKCPTTLRLIRNELRVADTLKGKLVKRRKGVPQGSPSALSNILPMNWQRIEEKRSKFVRYADDFSIYTKSKIQAKTVGNKIFSFFERQAKLTINKRAGLETDSVHDIGFLLLHRPYQKGVKGTIDCRRQSLGKTRRV